MTKRKKMKKMEKRGKDERNHLDRRMLLLEEDFISQME
jgi:hypothetical protein